MVGTELVIEMGGASMPAGCSGGSGGGGPVQWKMESNLKSHRMIGLRNTQLVKHICSCDEC